ncbi:MAG: PspA/IM30 family protein [Methylococcales bacterium]
MTLIDRITRLFRADIHDLLDRIEDPSIVLKQAVRDMEQELSQDEQSIRQAQREQDGLASRLKEIESTLEGIETHLGVCFDSGKDDLAKRLIKKRLEMQSLHKQLARKKGHLEETLILRKSSFEENRSRLEEIRQKAELLAVEDLEDSLAREPVYCEAVIREEDVEVALLREKQIRSLP